MPRPCCRRHVGCAPRSGFFKPSGIPAYALEQLALTLDEVESLRLADLEGLYQEQAAGRMNVSRATFARIVEGARRKVADALVNGKALRIEGGNVEIEGEEQMPGRDGTGPVGRQVGRGLGPCGCGKRRGQGGNRGAGLRRRGMPQEIPTNQQRTESNKPEAGQEKEQP